MWVHQEERYILLVFFVKGPNEKVLTDLIIENFKDQNAYG